MSRAPMMMFAGPLFAMATPPDGGLLPPLILFAVMVGIFYFIVLQPMQRKQAKVQTFQQSLKVGDRVVTTGGIYGQITKISNDVVQLQIADKVRIDLARAAIGGYQGQPALVDSSNP
ncbi:MAG: preprotein translocase subunit YajC [Hyphomonadaceae bacterium]